MELKVDNGVRAAPNGGGAGAASGGLARALGGEGVAVDRRGFGEGAAVGGDGFGRVASDERLMALMAGGDAVAFAALYRRHASAAGRLALQMCQSAAIAEEVVQEAFLSLWRSRGHFDRSRGSVRTWVLGIVRNRAIDALRHGSAHELAIASYATLAQVAVEAAQVVEMTESKVRRRERADALRSALDLLPPEQSCVIVLAYYGGYSHSEIAAMLGAPVGTVKGRMRLGLRKMAGTVGSRI